MSETPGEIVMVHTLGPREIVDLRHDPADQHRCPVCGQLGWVWRNWFSCTYCPCVAAVGGLAMMPVEVALEEGT